MEDPEGFWEYRVLVFSILSQKEERIIRIVLQVMKNSALKNIY